MPFHAGSYLAVVDVLAFFGARVPVVVTAPAVCLHYGIYGNLLVG